MIQEEIIKFHKPVNSKDIDLVENVIYPIFFRNTNNDKQYLNEIKSSFLAAMKEANLNFLKRYIFWLYVYRTITQGIKKGLPLVRVEDTLRKFIRNHAGNEKDKKEYAIKRAKMNFDGIKDYIKGKRVLDLGAGNGLLAKEIKEKLGKDVILVDIEDYNYTDLQMILYSPDSRIPLKDEDVDTTILYTVLHHASDPIHLLDEATRITKTRLIIKEAYVEEDHFRISNSFFDWFYNRVIGDQDINVPLNFLRINGWEKILKSYGYKVTQTKYLGIDEPFVPEYHIFIIADKINN